MLLIYGPASSPEEVVQFDLGRIAQCDLFVAVCTVDSTGLGIELREAGLQGKPTLVTWAQGRVTRMVSGAKVYHPNCIFVQYVDILDVADAVAAHFKES